jgi:hypothetical protein
MSIDTPADEPPANDEQPTPRQRLADARSRLRGWWLWTERPLSYAATWRLSAVDRRRLPKGGPWWLLKLWQVGNGSERLVWFAVMLLAPCGAQGMLRWAAARPTRRWGTYLLLALLAAGLYASTRTR